MDQKTRKLMIRHKALHPKDDVDRLYVSRKEGRRRLASIENSVDTSIQPPEDYIEKVEGGLITPVQENDTHKLLWGFDIHTDHLISARRPDLIIINKKKKRI